MNYQDLIVSGKGVSQTIGPGESGVDIIVKNSATLRVLSGGYVSHTTVYNNARLSNGGVADSTFLSGGTMYVSNGGVANGVQVLREAKLFVRTGAVATGVNVAASGNVNATAIGGDSITRIEGVNSLGGFYLSNGVASNFLISSTGQLTVSSGGTALGATVKFGGFLTVLSGGTALDVTVSAGGHVGFTLSGNDQKTVIRGLNERGSFSLSGGVASNFIIYDGYDTQEIRSGGTAINTIVTGVQGFQYIYAGAVASATSVGRNGCLQLNDGGSAVNAVISSGGSMNVCDGARVFGALVSGVMSVESGTAGADESAGSAALRDVTIARQGLLKVTKNADFGGIVTLGGSAALTSKMTLTSGARLAFDLAERTAADDVILNDWSKVALGSGSVSVSIGDATNEGIYKLAAGAGSFGTTTVTVYSDATEIGSLSAGGSLSAEGMNYALAVTSDVLQFTVTDVGPELDGAPQAAVSGYTATITWKPARDRSGVAKYILDINGKKYETTDTSYDFYSNVFGDYSCMIQAIDSTGHASEWSAAANFAIVDFEPPAFDGALNAEIAAGQVTFSWSPATDQSQVSYKLEINGEEFVTADTGYVFTPEKERQYLCRVKAVDSYGNESQWSDTVRFETVAPTLAGAPVVTVDVYNVTVNWEPATDQSGIAKYIVRVDGAEQETAENELTFRYKKFGEHACQIQAVDVYGNTSVWSDAVNFTVVDVTPHNVALSTDGASWNTAVNFEDCVAELSADGFKTVLPFAVADGRIDFYNLAAGSYKLQVRAAVDDAYATSNEAVVAATETGAVFFDSDADTVADAFFAQSGETWGEGYYAKHTGTAGWSGGTGEIVSLEGKNRIANVFRGSDDASVLFLSDDANGDALALDDIYTARPAGEESPIARFAAIDEVRAGLGDDVVDLTSTEFNAVDMTIRGGDGDDRIWSGDGKNRLFGDAGNDNICGGDGDDAICGGSGYDRMQGGGGSDIFTFADNWGHDTVTQTAEGKITLWFVDGITAADVDVAYESGNTVVRRGDNSVTVMGRELAADELRFGAAGYEAQYSELEALGAFADFSSVGIFEEREKFSAIAALS